jgi:hypothetical protein
VSELERATKAEARKGKDKKEWGLFSCLCSPPHEVANNVKNSAPRRLQRFSSFLQDVLNNENSDENDHTRTVASFGVFFFCCLTIKKSGNDPLEAPFNGEKEKRVGK